MDKQKTNDVIARCITLFDTLAPDEQKAALLYLTGVVKEDSKLKNAAVKLLNKA